MVKYLIFSILILTGCNDLVSVLNTTQTATPRATCLMNNFEGFPSEVTGEVSFQLKNFLTLIIENKKQTEKVEITFNKKKCKVL